MIDSWLKAVNEDEFVGCVMIDFQKVFDLVDHTYMAQNLHHLPPLSICYLLYGIGNSW